MEFFSLLCYFIIGLVLINLNIVSQTISATLILGFLVLANAIRAIELWKFKRKEKAYYYHVLILGLSLLLIIITFLGERYLI